LGSNKSNILEQLSNNYPNFLKKDLTKFVNIILNEIENALKKNERVELRDIFTLETRIQKARMARNPKTNEKININQKKSIKFKMSKEWFNNINEK
jgi:integration host factor subunit beta